MTGEPMLNRHGTTAQAEIQTREAELICDAAAEED